MIKKYPLFSVPEIDSIQKMILMQDMYDSVSDSTQRKVVLQDLFDSKINSLTARELLINILKFGDALKELGIKSRTHIAVLGENRVQWGLTYLTSMFFNHVIVPIDKNLPENEILNILHEANVEVIVYSDSFHQMIQEKRNILRKIKFFINMDQDSSDKDSLSMTQLISNAKVTQVKDAPKINPDELAVIIYTSGSLGRAKGVMLSQKNIASNLMSMTSMIEITPDDKFLSVLPMHHTYECTCGFLCPLYSGASVYYAKSLKTVVDDLQRSKATILLAVPLLYEKMFKNIYRNIKSDKTKSLIIGPMIKITNFFQNFGWKGAKKTLFSELHKKFGGAIRLFIAGGAAPDPAIAKGLQEFGFNFIQGYGLTETSPILALNRLECFKDDAAGLPLPGIEIKIDSPNEEGIGEIWAKGPSVMLGYYNNQKLTDEAFSDGWFRTGDIGFFDSDGFLHINGRKKNVIIAKNGKNVYPEEIEDVLNRDPFIQESLVFGEKDEKQDEIIAVQIVVDTETVIEYADKNNKTISEEFINGIIFEVIKTINKDLPIYKQIKKFYIRQKEFEKTTTQKIKRYLNKN